jgi:hypothetical protein
LRFTRISKIASMMLVASGLPTPSPRRAVRCPL